MDPPDEVISKLMVEELRADHTESGDFVHSDTNKVNEKRIGYVLFIYLRFSQGVQLISFQISIWVARMLFLQQASWAADKLMKSWILQL